MYLSDSEIHHRLDVGDLEIEPVLQSNKRLQPATIDVRLGDTFCEFDDTACHSPIDPATDSIADYMHYTEANSDGSYILDTGDFTIATTQERLDLPNDLIAFVHGRSTYGRVGIGVHSTAGLIDPGFSGQITLELFNNGPAPVTLHAGNRIAQLSFAQLGKEAAREYGHEDRNSKYDGQGGPQPARPDQ